VHYSIDEGLHEGSTYLTPTQRKNNEIKRLRAELNKAQETIHARDREIRLLRCGTIIPYVNGSVAPE
jgi:hypothetical protein